MIIVGCTSYGHITFECIPGITFDRHITSECTLVYSMCSTAWSEVRLLLLLAAVVVGFGATYEYDVP